MNNEPIICKKCAHRQFSGTHCDYCGNPLFEKPAKKKLSKWAWIRILGFAGILAIGFVYLTFFRHAPPPTALEPAPVTLFPAQQSGVLNKVMQTAAKAKDTSDTPTGEQIFAKAAPGIVSLFQDDSAGKPQRIIAAGFLLDNTTIATTAHSLHGVADITARFSDGTDRKVNHVLKTNQQHDITLLMIDKIDDSTSQQAIDSLEAASKQVDAAGLSTAAPSTAHTATNGLDIGRTAALNVGDTVIAAGTPRGLGGSLAQGIVTAMPNGLIKTNLPVSSGWSGGPLLNMQGEVVGMLTSAPPGDPSGNYALPIEWATGLEQGTDGATNSGTPAQPGAAQTPSHDFGPYTFKLAAAQKRSISFTTPSDLESALFSARLTAPAGAHLHFTISHQGHVMYDSGDTAGAHFTLSLKRGDYVMLVENKSSTASSDISIAGTFTNDI